MAYSEPTATELKAAFPAFSGVPDDTVAYWIDRSASSVDESWTEADYPMAKMLLAAHEMVLNGLGTGTEAQIAASGLTGVKSMRSGSLSLDFGDSASVSATGGFAATSYGRRFAELLKRNRGGALVTPTGTIDQAPYGYPPLYREGE